MPVAGGDGRLSPAAPSGGAAIACPGCGAAMRALALGRKPHGEAVVDLCPACRGLWFDAHESLQLTPEATLALLREAAALADAQSPRHGGTPACPRCRRALAATQDVQRTTRFTYWRCPRGHGRFTPFVQFMREKDFVRPLAPAEIAQVRAQIGTVRCSGCGASVDLGREPACSYCGARIEALDPEAIRRAIAAPPSTRTPPSPEAAIDALLAAQRTKARRPFESGADLVFGGLDFLLGGLTAD
ncbi:MAG: zf-TFIIB domain-containing protein [Betaproteobacteria bacterium]|nr:zf-TFIIB domain-containing protein [Betaproteobacteria bacterium]